MEEEPHQSRQVRSMTERRRDVEEASESTTLAVTDSEALQKSMSLLMTQWWWKGKKDGNESEKWKKKIYKRMNF